MFAFNLRFAGQQYDAESGLHYNYFRYYDPSTGRYLTSDPLGIYPSLNTYAYVDSNPLYWAGPYGLFPAAAGARAGVPIPPGNAAGTGSTHYPEANGGSAPYPSSSVSGAINDGASAIMCALYGMCTEAPEEEAKKCPTPDTNPEDFENVRKSKAKKNKKTGEYWEPDLLHKDHWEVYKNRKKWEKGKRGRDVWKDGRPKRTF